MADKPTDRDAATDRLTDAIQALPDKLAEALDNFDAIHAAMPGDLADLVAAIVPFDGGSDLPAPVVPDALEPETAEAAAWDVAALPAFEPPSLDLPAFAEYEAAAEVPLAAVPPHEAPELPAAETLPDALIDPAPAMAAGYAWEPHDEAQVPHANAYPDGAWGADGEQAGGPWGETPALYDESSDEMNGINADGGLAGAMSDLGEKMDSFKASLSEVVNAMKQGIEKDATGDAHSPTVERGAPSHGERGNNPPPRRGAGEGKSGMDDFSRLLGNVLKLR